MQILLEFIERHEHIQSSLEAFGFLIGRGRIPQEARYMAAAHEAAAK